MDRTRRTALRALRPAVLGSSLAYSGALYVAGLNAGILDVQSAYWVVTVGAVLLFSPLYHGFVLPWAAADGRPQGVGSAVLAVFPRLFLGQLLVGAGAVLGAVAFVVPGVYFGVRSVFYKQAIVLEGAQIMPSVRASFARTASARTALWSAASLVVYYGAIVGADLLFSLLGSGVAAGILSVAVSGALLALLNAFLTDLYVRPPETRLVEGGGSAA